MTFFNGSKLQRQGRNVLEATENRREGESGGQAVLDAPTWSRRSEFESPVYTLFFLSFLQSDRREDLKLSTRGMLQFKIPGIGRRKELAEADTCELISF